MKTHYVYFLIKKETGEFYIGSRSCTKHPDYDFKYKGSMVTWKTDKLSLEKKILRIFQTREEAFEHESELIKKFIKDPLNRNYYIPTKGFTSYGKEAYNKKNKEDFLKKIKEMNINYDFQKFEYINNRVKGIAICQKHGEFNITPNKLYRKQGCRQCYLELKRQPSSTTENFINKSKIKHNNRYDYSLVDYNGQLSKVKIICKIHGMFEQTPKAHLIGQGCKKCRNDYFSKLYKLNIK